MKYPGYEADDVIGTLARQASKKDLEIFIVTSDKDLMQLVGGRVRLLNPAKGDLIIDQEIGRNHGRAAEEGSGRHGPHG